MATCRLLDLPNELLTRILSHTTTPSFVQAAATCHKLFNLAADSRDVVLQHLYSLPGIKLGLDDHTVSTQDLFLLFRQRASRCLYGASLNADCIDLRYRNASVDADASCMAELGADYITVSMVMKDSLTVRLYGSKCALLKEKIDSPYCGGVGKVLQVVHRKHTVSVLYQWHRVRNPVPEFEKPLTTKTLAETMIYNPKSILPVEDTADKTPPQKVKYHLLHYNAYTLDRPYFFSIEPYKNLVPAHLTVNSRLHCAILWDKKDHKIEPSDSAEIVLYTAIKCPVNEEGTYDTRVIWPTTHEIRPVPPTSDDIITGKAQSRPKRISFYKEGRRLKLFDAGGVIPYNVISAGTSYDSRAGSNQVAFETGTVFRVDTPFFGTHETYTDEVEEQTYCNLSHLGLAIAEVGSATHKCKMLCILRSKTRYDHEDCAHTVNLSRMAHVSAQNCKAVARLWGWSENHTSLTGLETVSISKFGTRIAIASWDKVYIWALDPKILCEDVHDIDSDEEEHKTPKSSKKRKPKVKGVADDFYTRVKDPTLGWRIAELKPIVLDLKGAVARQMTWSLIDEEEEPSESEVESEVGESTSQQKITEVVPEPDHDAEKSSTELNADTPATVKEKKDPLGPDPEPQCASEANAGLKCTPAIETNGASKDTTLAPLLIEEFIKRPLPEKLSKETDATILKMSNERMISQIMDHQRCRQIIIEEKQPEAETLVVLPPQLPNLGTVSATIIQPLTKPTPIAIVTEAPPLEAEDELPKSPKGKEREIDPETLPESGASLLLDASNSSVSGTADQGTSRPKKHRKRHTEDELVIMTDRGIQIWDLGALGKGKRARQWLSER